MKMTNVSPGDMRDMCQNLAYADAKAPFSAAITTASASASLMSRPNAVRLAGPDRRADAPPDRRGIAPLDRRDVHG